jgi:uncharacterized spore protein YtfJ
MEQIKKLLEAVRARLSGVALKDAVVSKPLTAGNQHVLVLSEVSFGFGGGSGTGENSESGKGPARGSGGGVFGMGKASPVAVLVVEQGKVRLEKIGR